MNKSKRGGTVLIALGLLLFAAALLLIAYNLFEERRAGDEAHNVLKQLQQQIQSPEASSAPDRNSGAEAQPPEPDPDGAAPSAPSAPLESPDYILNPNKEMPKQK